MESIKPPEKFIKLIAHIEDKYSCSGLCTTPLFYLTQSVTKGPPKIPCLVPLLKDVSLLLQNLGAAMIVAGILFFFMIFCSIPICYYNKEKEVTEQDEEDQSRSAAYRDPGTNNQGPN